MCWSEFSIVRRGSIHKLLAIVMPATIGPMEDLGFKD